MELENEVTLDEIENPKILFLVMSKPYLSAPLKDTDPAVLEQGDMIRLTIKTYNDIMIYFRNVDACIQNQKMNRPCTRRVRFNTPTIKRILEVKTKDLGDLFIVISGSVRQISILLGQLSNSLIADKDLVQGGKEYNDTKNLIQNTMDAMRYLAPAFTCLSRFYVRLTEGTISVQGPGLEHRSSSAT